MCPLIPDDDVEETTDFREIMFGIDGYVYGGRELRFEENHDRVGSGGKSIKEIIDNKPMRLRSLQEAITDYYDMIKHRHL